jgi:uncharacterized protein (DUF952 family)
MADLFHITERPDWAAAQTAGEYRMSTRGVTLEQEGFIHCSGSPQQLRGVADYLYDDADDLVVLIIDSDRLDVQVKYDAPAPGAESYPHVYGAVPVEAVREVVTVGRDAAGRMVLPE